jgi:hypothetical protein
VAQHSAKEKASENKDSGCQPEQRRLEVLWERRYPIDDTAAAGNGLFG